MFESGKSYIEIIVEDTGNNINDLAIEIPRLLTEASKWCLDTHNAEENYIKDRIINQLNVSLPKVHDNFMQLIENNKRQLMLRKEKVDSIGKLRVEIIRLNSEYSSIQEQEREYQEQIKIRDELQQKVNELSVIAEIPANEISCLDKESIELMLRIPNFEDIKKNKETLIKELPKLIEVVGAITKFIGAEHLENIEELTQKHTAFQDKIKENNREIEEIKTRLDLTKQKKQKLEDEREKLNNELVEVEANNRVLQNSLNAKRETFKQEVDALVEYYKRNNDVCKEKIKDNIPNEIKQICDNFESYMNKCRAELDKYDKALKPFFNQKE
jgi:chromosome segregation ATPase